ncbi:endonuclease/exonuclease/phosphatase family protein [Ammoniphilus sp. 3BR4]|uniref:endonuclease/exonuclease/phosphatase family protein n=1 Tax=Ammoniphilus sp. 3BR4 TaxID=3158265 RepID=UPI0034675AB3
MKKKTFYLLCFCICIFLPLYISSGLCTVNNQFHYGFNEAKSIRVMTFNIRGARNEKGEVNLSAVAEQIKKMDPDIIALQEVDFRLPRSHFQNQTKILGELLQMNYLFVPNQNFLIGSYGNAIFSKFPITDFDRHLLPSSIENRGVLRAQIHTGTQPIDVYATHLGLNSKEIARQISSIATTMSLKNGPKLLLGDFNSKPVEIALQSIRSLYIDPIYERKMDIVTYQHHSRKTQLDYIFYTDDFLFEDAFTEVSHISDHYPLMYSLFFNLPNK